MPKKSSNSPVSRKKYLFVLFVLLFLAAIVVLVLELTNTTYIFHKKKVPPTIPVATHKNQPTQDKKTASAATNAQTSTDSPKEISSGSRSSGGTQDLVQPYGSFVSNHIPGQGGSNTKEESVCSTSPGASCYIQFTSNASGKTTKLPAQTTGSDGSTVWSWDANTLTSGEWQITAVAAQGGQTKTTNDSAKLEIQ